MEKWNSLLRVIEMIPCHFGVPCRRERASERTVRRAFNYFQAEICGNLCGGGGVVYVVTQ